MKRKLRVKAAMLATALSVSMVFPATAATTVAPDGQMVTQRTWGLSAGWNDMKMTIRRISAEQFGYFCLLPAPAGYEYHFFEFDTHGQNMTADPWNWYITGAVSNYTPGSTHMSMGVDTPSDGWGMGGVAFTATVNGQAYPSCGAYMYPGGQNHELQLAVLLPAGCQEAFTITINPYKWDNSQNTQSQVNHNGSVGYIDSSKVARTAGNCHQVNYDDEIAYYITGAPSTQTAQTTQTTQPNWVSDASGWRVQNADGTYLTSQWHEYNNQWYYLGADGYMLTSTTTPDGYQVNADGVWVQ